MPSYNAPRREFRFIVREVLALGRNDALPEQAEAAGELLDVILDSAARFCEEVLLPLNASGDREGCRLVDGAVSTPRGFRDAWRRLAAGGWLCASADPRYGGHGLPGVLGEALAEMLVSANFSFSGYADLTEAAFGAILAHGTDAQRRTYLQPMARGDWTGSMHLTESGAGSDLSLLRTRARPDADGTFRLHGTKTFITAADHDLADNAIGLALARLPDAPPGTRGISLFIVPKCVPLPTGGPGPRNAVGYSSIEHKMGLRGAVTGTLEYDGAWCEMLGAPNQGLRAMFTMVNDTRLGVALQGLGVAEVAAQNAAAHARERRQGRAPGTSAAAGTDAIVAHPDVRRMLAQMRAFTGAARALALEVALRIDLSRQHPDAAQRRRAADFVGLMTPVIKAYFTDMGHEVAQAALQCFGGYGYIVDTGIEQFVRDVRVTRIYEGTNGIQAMDLASRKLAADGGAAMAAWCDEVAQAIAAASADPVCAALAAALAQALAQLRQASAELLAADAWTVACGASDYLRSVALVAMGWSWLRIAVAARAGASGAGAEGAAFYAAQLWHARCFMHWLLPEVGLCLQRIMHGAAQLPPAGIDPF